MTTAEPKVRVLMVTYNHVDYIQQAVDSALMQETDFPFELVIGDDASTDGTRDVLIRYQERYPDRIRLILHDRNHGGRVNFMQTYHACADTPYVAILEGDDYWTSPEKLQKQVDALEARPDWAMCFHLTRWTWENGAHADRLYPRDFHREVTGLRDILEDNYISTPSIMFRGRIIEKLPDWFADLPLGDWPLHILNAHHGDIGFIDEAMAVYRIHPNGRWSSKDRCWGIGKVIEMMQFMKPHLDAKYHNIIHATISRNFYDMAVAHRQQGRRFQAAKAAARCWLSSPRKLPTGRRELLRLMVTGVLPRRKARMASAG